MTKSSLRTIPHYEFMLPFPLKHQGLFCDRKMYNTPNFRALKNDVHRIGADIGKSGLIWFWTIAGTLHGFIPGKRMVHADAQYKVVFLGDSLHWEEDCAA